MEDTIKESKVCTKCLIDKPFSEFYKCRRESDGLVDACKICCSNHCKQYREKNKIKMREHERNLWYKNHEKNIERSRLYYTKEYRQKNKYKIREYQRKCISKKYKTNPRYNLKSKISTLIRQSLRRHGCGGTKGGRKWEILVGYNLELLHKHFETLFVGGMTWDKFLLGEITVDHILPESLFIYDSPDNPQFKACWAISNLRPVWKEDNDKKSDYLPDGRRVRDLTKEEKLEYLKLLGYNF